MTSAASGGPFGHVVRFMRLAGSSVAAPDAAPWVTDFLNAAYYARPAHERSVDDLRLAFCVLTTRWHRGGRRLHLWDLPRFHRAFGPARLVRRGGVGRLARDDLLSGAGRLLGAWFPGAYADPERRGWGIAFESAAEREANRPEKRLERAKLGPLTPPTSPDATWKTYRPVPAPDVPLLLSRLTSPERWPDHGADLGRFTPIRSTGLLGQTFEIEIIAPVAGRLPMLTRGYVTATKVELGDRPESLARLIADLDAGLAATGRRALPEGHRAVAAVRLTTHEGHFMGSAHSHIVVSEGPDGGALRDVGVWDPMPPAQAAAYHLGGDEAQRAFWGEAEPENSMLHQLAAAGP